MQPTKYQIAATDGAAIFAAFAKWINQRPGLEPGNYDHNGYRSEALRIARDGREARAALKAAQYFPFDPAAMQDALDRAFSGRLQWEVVCHDPRHATPCQHRSKPCEACTAECDPKHTRGRFDYTTGQYWPTEYRIAARAVLDRYVETVRPKILPGGKIPRTVQEIKAANAAAGGHFFDRDSMRFFRSRVVPGVHVGPGGVYFVTSEQYVSSQGEAAARGFTVRLFDPQTGDVDSVGKFNEMTRGQAITDAKARAAGKQVAA